MTHRRISESAAAPTRRWLTPAEAAQLLVVGVDIRSCRRWLRSLRIRPDIRFTRTMLEDWLQDRWRNGSGDAPGRVIEGRR
jgi:hypothetical protein